MGRTTRGSRGSRLRRIRRRSEQRTSENATPLGASERPPSSRSRYSSSNVLPNRPSGGAKRSRSPMYDSAESQALARKLANELQDADLIWLCNRYSAGGGDDRALRA